MELTRPFAEKGDRQDFPVDTQGDGSMSLQQGFGAFYGLPPEEGGLFIQRPQFNQLMYLVSKGVIDNKTSIKALESKYGSLSTSSAKLLTKNLTWTVGTGGNYTTLQDALEEASRLSPIFINNGIKLVLKLKTGFNWNFKLIIKNVNLSFVELQSENSLINIASSVFNSGGNLIYFENCLPFEINASFKLASVVSGSVFARYHNCAKAVVSPNLIFDGFDTAFDIIQSNFSIVLATIRNNKSYGVIASSSMCTLSGSTFSNNGTAIYNIGGSNTYMYQGEINNSTTNSVSCTNGFVGFFQSKISQTSGTHCNVGGGGVISLVQTTPTGGADYSQAINILTGKGIIYTSY